MTPEERKAFKERMKQLKAYREQNPGKGYWDFKDDRTDHPVEKPKMSIEPIKRVYTINQGKPDDSWKKRDKDGDGDLSPEERMVIKLVPQAKRLLNMCYRQMRQIQDSTQ